MAGDNTGLHPEVYGFWFLSLTTGVTQRFPFVLNIKMFLVDNQASLASVGVTWPWEWHFKVPRVNSSFTASTAVFLASKRNLDSFRGKAL